MSLNLLSCTQCCANDFYEKDGQMVCKYCGSKFDVSPVKVSDYVMNKKALGEKKIFSQSVDSSSMIALDEDIQRLLEKCRKEPKKAKRYANLILDIDPTNKEALKYL